MRANSLPGNIRLASLALTAALGLGGPAAHAARDSADSRQTKVGRVKAESPSSLPVLGGVVSDINRAVVAGARVILTGDGGKKKLAATTDDEGRFRFPAVEPGEYRVTVESPGFKLFVKKGLKLDSGEDVALGVTLFVKEPGGLTPAAAAAR
jgi:Carboxypeptidase regulatory-like domain